MLLAMVALVVAGVMLVLGRARAAGTAGRSCTPACAPTWGPDRAG